MISNHAMAPQTAPMCIVNPFAGGVGGTFLNLFSTHPPMEKRIAALVSASLASADRWRRSLGVNRDSKQWAFTKLRRSSSRIEIDFDAASLLGRGYGNSGLIDERQT